MGILEYAEPIIPREEKKEEKPAGLTKEEYEKLSKELKEATEVAKKVGEAIYKGLSELKEALAKKKVEEVFKSAEVPIVKPTKTEYMEELGIEKL